VLELRSPTGARLPSWQPGAHIDLLLPGGLIRQYSLCGDPGDHGAYTIAVLREDNGRGGPCWRPASMCSTSGGADSRSVVILLTGSPSVTCNDLPL
jgi:ferredoxin-NADP reductase